MGLADIMLGGGGVLFGRHPKVTTPPFQPNRGVQVPPAGGAGPDLAQADSLSVDPNTGLTANQATLRDALAHPPQEGVDPTTGRPISKFRKIMGTVASVAGPMIGGPGVTGLGDKLLHPGMEAWQQKVARANALSNLDMTALQHRDLQQNRADMSTARAAMQTDREQGNIDRVENKGAWQVPLGSLSQKLMHQENAPQTGDPIADLPTRQMNLKGGIATGADVIDPRTGKRAGDVGDVEMMDKPGTQGKDKVAMLRPSQATLGDFAAETDRKKKEAEKTSWVDLPDDISSALKLPAGMKVPNLAPYAQMYEAKMKDNSLHFESHVNETSGDVTTLGMDPKTGEVKFSNTVKGIAQKRAPTPPDKGQNFIDPATGKMVRVEPGGDVPAGAITAAGMNTQNTATAATRTMAETAPKVADLADRVGKLVDQQKASLGPAASRWGEFMAGKVGAPNPEFTKLRTDVALLQTALMRMHVGARGGEQMMQHFHDLIDVAKQSPENLTAALGEIRAYAREVAASAQQHTASPQSAPPTGLPHDGGPPTVTTKAQYDALPKGAIYMEDGVKYQKP